LIVHHFFIIEIIRAIRKIRRSLLGYVTGHGNEESISELSCIINETDKQERVILQEALQNARQEMGTRPTRLESSRVVGITCAATSFPILTSHQFPFVLLDECSQQTEPVSLLPISFGCQRLICCGDPQQLPPSLSRESRQGYGRPLFSRLQSYFTTILLSIQYRCHPAISKICSRLFYDNRVQDGICSELRNPLFGLPTLCVFDVVCGEEKYERGSTCNIAEAITVVSLVRYLLNIGISSEEIGVIAFYRSQVEIISEPLSSGRKRSIVDVSTIDAFQGDEREVIIITTAKTAKTSFLECKERVNVAISRAKRHLFVVSNVRPLIDSEMWNIIFSIMSNKPHMRIKLNHPPETGWQPFFES
jgi:superfamily I DNA and/or RNA helicase